MADRTIPVMLSYFDQLGSGDAFRRMCILDALSKIANAQIKAIIEKHNTK